MKFQNQNIYSTKDLHILKNSNQMFLVRQESEPAEMKVKIVFFIIKKNSCPLVAKEFGFDWSKLKINNLWIPYEKERYRKH